MPTPTLYLAMERELLVVRPQHGRQVEHRLVGMQTTCLAVDPFRPERVYCGTFGRGLWRSDDCGDSWQPIGDPGEAMEPPHGAGITHAKIMSVAVSSSQRVGEYGVVYAGTEPSALFRSDDGGETWRELVNLLKVPSAPTWSFPPRPYTSLIRWITPDPLVPGRIFVAAEAGALLRSLDGGETWGDRRPGGPFDSHTVVMHPLAPDRLYCAAGDGYFESIDGGDTWHKPADGLPFRYLWSVAVDPADPDTVVVSAAPSAMHAHHLRDNAQAGLYRKVREQPWQRSSAGLPGEIGTVIPIVATIHTQPGTFYALSNRGLFRSTDTGVTWESLDVPWDTAYVTQHQQALVVGEA